MSRRFTLGRNERLKSRKAIDRLFKDAQRFNVPPFRVFFIIEPQLNDNMLATFTVQFGVGVAAKNFPRAVHRNRVKRLVREAYRLQKLPLQEKLKERKLKMQLFIIYTAKELPDHLLVKDKVKNILNRLLKQADENNFAHS